MMIRFRICLLLLLLTLVSCNQPRYIYSQNARNLHFFQEKGQAKLSAAWSTGPSRGTGGSEKNYNHGADLQAAYAFANRWALTASYFSRKEKDIIQVITNDVLYNDVRYERQAMEAGLSYFIPVDRQFASYFHFDGGVGWGKNHIDDKGTFDSLGLSRVYNDKILRLYLQQGFYTGHRAVRFGMGVRLQWAKYSDIKSDYTQAELAKYHLNDVNDMFMIEPYAAFRYGPRSTPWLKGELQLSFATSNTNHYIRGTILSLGIAIDPSGKAR